MLTKALSSWPLIVLLSLSAVDQTLAAQVAVNPSGTRIYLTANQRDSVLVIDTETREIVALWSVGSSPGGIAVNPGGTRVYVSNFLSDDVSVIDASTGVVVATVPVEPGPSGIAAHPSGDRIYVMHKWRNTVCVIDVRQNAVIGKLLLGKNDTGPGAPTAGIAIDPDGKSLYVTNALNLSRKNSVVIIDTADLALATVVQVGKGPHGLAIHPSGTDLYVTNRGDHSVSVIDTSRSVVSSTIPVGHEPEAIALTRDGSKALVTNYGDNTISIIDTVSKSISATVEVNGRPRGLAMHPALRELYVLENEGIEARTNVLWIIDLEDNAVKMSIDLQIEMTDQSVPSYPKIGSWCNLNSENGLRAGRIRR